MCSHAWSVVNSWYSFDSNSRCEKNTWIYKACSDILVLYCQNMRPTPDFYKPVPFPCSATHVPWWQHVTPKQRMAPSRRWRAHRSFSWRLLSLCYVAHWKQFIAVSQTDLASTIFLLAFCTESVGTLHEFSAGTSGRWELLLCILSSFEREWCNILKGFSV